MVSRSERERQLAEIKRSVRIYNLSLLLVGCAAVASAVILAEEELLQTFLAVVGGALLSAALISFVLGSVTIRETTLEVRHSLLKGMEDVLTPVTDALVADALADYRWDCYLDLADEELNGMYADQLVRISYRDSRLPRELRLVCVSSMLDDVLEPYLKDPRYIFRWTIEPGLDPTDEAVFALGYLRVDGKALASRKYSAQSAGTPAAEYRVQVPRELREIDGPLIDFSVLVKKFARDRLVRIQSHLFKSVTNAEYRMTVGNRFPEVAISVHPSVIALGPSRQRLLGPTYAGRYGERSAHAVFNHPVQAGSNVAFVVDRLDSQRASENT